MSSLAVMDGIVWQEEERYGNIILEAWIKKSNLVSKMKSCVTFHRTTSLLKHDECPVGNDSRQIHILKLIFIYHTIAFWITDRKFVTSVYSRDINHNLIRNHMHKVPRKQFLLNKSFYDRQFELHDMRHYLIFLIIEEDMKDSEMTSQIRLNSRKDRWLSLPYVILPCNWQCALS